jgi:hypothetical protein
VGGSAGRCCGAFEAFYWGAEDEALAGANLFDGGENLCAEVSVLALKVEHGDGFKSSVVHSGSHRSYLNPLQVPKRDGTG